MSRCSFRGISCRERNYAVVRIISRRGTGLSIFSFLFKSEVFFPASFLASLFVFVCMDERERERANPCIYNIYGSTNTSMHVSLYLKSILFIVFQMPAKNSERQGILPSVCPLFSFRSSSRSAQRTHCRSRKTPSPRSLINSRCSRSLQVIKECCLSLIDFHYGFLGVVVVK